MCTVVSLAATSSSSRYLVVSTITGHRSLYVTGDF
eukprot:SAG31_NODE_33494_length_343_cov_0.819672_1_plen_34_part_10